MVPCPVETVSIGGTGHGDTEGSIDTPLHVWLLVFYWIGWLWVMQKNYYLT